MVRRVIKIDQDACNGCGLCAAACHEGAIGMVDGKATLLKDEYCDGLGDCLPTCPTGAITFEEREAAAYDEAAVQARMAQRQAAGAPTGGCPGQAARALHQAAPAAADPAHTAPEQPSALRQWPVQIKLAPVTASFYENAHLLIAADCTAYAYANFHQAFMRNKITLIGCPKLDMADYSEKLTAILQGNTIKSVTVVRMEVPCCGGIEAAVKQALQNSGKLIPWQVVTISTDGRVLEA